MKSNTFKLFTMNLFLKFLNFVILSENLFLNAENSVNRKNFELYWDFKSLSCSFDNEFIAPNFTCSVNEASRSSVGTFNIYFVMIKDLADFYVGKIIFRIIFYDYTINI